MKIKYKRIRMYANLGLGIVWILLGVINFIEDDTIRWTDYGYLLAGILYLGQFFWDNTNQYLTIENGVLTKNSLLKKKINLDKIIWIKKFAGDYTLKTENQELKIDTELIEDKSLSELNNFLKELSLPADKTPFSNTVQY